MDTLDTTGVKTDRTVEKVPGRIPALTGLRWWAALSVFFYHALSGPGIFPPTLFGEPVKFLFAPAGAVGVSFFFVLSGFVLTWAARKKDTPRSFWRRRFFRIYPNHWAGCLLVVGLMLWTGDTTNFHHVIQTLLLVQVWTPDFMAAVGLNGVSWTLACEAAFYLCFPLLIWLVRRIRPELLWFWAGTVVLAVFLVPLASTLLPTYPLLPFGPPMSEAASWLVERFPLTRMFEFLLGILLARIVLEKRWIQIPLWTAWAAMAMGYALAMVTQTSLYGRVAFTLVPIALLIPAAAVADTEGRGSFASRPLIVWLGNISFAFYILHHMVLGHLSFLLGNGTSWSVSGALATVALALGVTILLAWLLHVLVEKAVYRRFAGTGSNLLTASVRR